MLAATLRRSRVKVVEPELVNPQQGLEGKRLELALRAAPDNRHGPRALLRKVFRGKRRCRRSPQRGENCHLTEKEWICGGVPSEKPK